MRSKLSDDSNSVSVQSQPHQSTWRHNLPAVYSGLPKADLHRTNMSECEECEQLMSGKTALNKSVNHSFHHFPAYTVMTVWFPWHGQGRRSESATQALKVEPGQNKSVLCLSHCIVGLATHNRGLLSKMRRATHTHTLKLGCNQGTTTNKCRGRPVPVSSHLSKASMQTNRKIKDNFVPGWWHLAEKPFGWTGPKSQWCMMNHVCWSHRCSGGPGWTQSSKLHATSFEVFGALTSGLQSHRAVSCVFHPKMVAFFDTKMVNLKGIKGTKSVFLKQNWDIP